jgi:hypothetical protein
MNSAFRKGLVCFWIVVLLTVGAWPCLSRDVEGTESLKILALYSWHKDMPWQISFERGLREQLGESGQPLY